jgi:hypothetical protein
MSTAQAGRLQHVLGAAACVCHHRRRAGLTDPASGDDAEWSRFLQWLESRLEESGELRRAYLLQQLKGDGSGTGAQRRGLGLALHAARTPNLLVRQALHRFLGSAQSRKLALEYGRDASGNKR